MTIPPQRKGESGKWKGESEKLKHKGTAAFKREKLLRLSASLRAGELPFAFHLSSLLLEPATFMRAEFQVLDNGTPADIIGNTFASSSTMKSTTTGN